MLHSRIKMAPRIQAEKGSVTAGGKFYIPLLADMGVYGNLCPRLELYLDNN